MIDRINHVSITVADIDASVSFYTDMLGLQLLGHGDASGSYLDDIIGMDQVELRWAEIEVGTQVLELLEYRRPTGTPVRSRTSDSGSVHIAFEVSNIDDLYQRLCAAGVTCRSAPVRGPRGARALYALDPDAVTIELVELPRAER